MHIVKVSYLRSEMALSGKIFFLINITSSFPCFSHGPLSTELRRFVSVIFVVLNETKINLYNYSNVVHIHYYLNSNGSFIRIYFVPLWW